MKKYWIYILAAILGLALIYTIKYYSNKDDKLIAQMIADKTMARHHAAVKKIRDKYDPLIAAATVKIGEANTAIDNLSDSAINKDREITRQRIEIAKLKSCDDKLIATNVVLDQAQGFILYLNNEYKIKVNALNLSHNYRYNLKVDEFNALDALHSSLIAEHGDTVRSLVIARLRARQRLNLGFFAGMSVGGSWAAGLGLTFDLIKVPVKLF